jgi:hypothetical protein
MDVETACRRVGPVAAGVEWFRTDHEMAHWISRYLNPGYAEGVAWKFAPFRVFPHCHELCLDNDVILWGLPPSMAEWLAESNSCLIAEDVDACFGNFAHLCAREPRNSGIRGLPPGFDLEETVRRLLEQNPVVLRSELDEQGLQVAALTRGRHHVVSLSEVTICSPFPPHLPFLGEYGAHFVGVNAKKLSWEYLGRSGEQFKYEHWDRHLDEVLRRVRCA